MSTFVTHPSVRIKGSENNFSPITCTDITCINRKNIHWHCPFCCKAESFNDVVILKAHYRVKHVDKGIEFAGLKVLRCCDTCDIVGAIKGEKKFKGAHWHCYRCRNGFNRRDEAIKHYRTHFRNPQTTFQIQIAQEVTQPNVYQEIETQISTNSIDLDDGSQLLPENVDCITPQYNVDLPTSDHVTSVTDFESVAANETVNSSPQALMLIQGGNMLPTTNNISEHDEASADGSYPTFQYSNGSLSGQLMCSNDPGSSDSKYMKLQIKYQEAVEDKARLSLTIEELKLEIQEHMNEIARYQKREEELLNQLSIPLDRGIQDLLKQLETQHRELLYHQLAHIKRTYPSLLHEGMEEMLNCEGNPDQNNPGQMDNSTLGTDAEEQWEKHESSDANNENAASLLRKLCDENSVEKSEDISPDLPNDCESLTKDNSRSVRRASKRRKIV